ncbi:MAG TPA: hypothetical protein VE954_31510, partial [Oligoflexus sp.]|uniref:hypothetical protein n=1 Tax=Oligoflexus sp. TaxID=1971216 RepID=UPI002D31021E
ILSKDFFIFCVIICGTERRLTSCSALSSACLSSRSALSQRLSSSAATPEAKNIQNSESGGG